MRVTKLVFWYSSLYIIRFLCDYQWFWMNVFQKGCNAKKIEVPNFHSLLSKALLLYDSNSTLSDLLLSEVCLYFTKYPAGKLRRIWYHMYLTDVLKISLHMLYTFFFNNFMVYIKYPQSSYARKPRHEILHFR